MANLVDNAIKYGDGAINVGISERVGSVILFVENTGEGLTREQIDGMFDFQKRMNNLKKDGLRHRPEPGEKRGGGFRRLCVGDLPQPYHPVLPECAHMLRSLLVALMILCAGNLLYAHTYSAAFEEASRGYALVTTEEYSQFETSDLGKNARDIFILARTYGSRILDIQLSMPTIADSLLGDRQGAPRSDTFKLIFTENLGALDDFASGSRVLRSGRAAVSSLWRGGSASSPPPWPSATTSRWGIRSR